MDAFLAAADAAERNTTDKLKRCLAYPDPPHSHWSRATVVAYCQYLFQPVMPVSEVRDLIAHGDAKELDQRLADAWRIQPSQPYAGSLTDLIYDRDFREAPDDLRPVLDNWKQQSPNSAFAFAASGIAYVAAAYRARGGEYIAETPQHKIDAMEKLAKLAKADLEKAVSIEPRLTSAYVGMIDLGGYFVGIPYALDAGKRGLDVDPSNYPIYSALTWLAQPKWGGSEDAMHAVVSQAQAHAKDNPLLVLLRAEPLAIAVNLDACGCHAAGPIDLASIFDQPASNDLLEGAGHHYRSLHDERSAAIYLAEAFRFGWSTPDNVSARIDGLVELNQLKFALALANRHLAVKPNDEQRLALRVEVYSRMDDPADAEKDLIKILSITKDDLWALTSLAHEYVVVDHDWDKGWAATDRLIKEYPAKSDGWFLRGSIQAQQPRPGLGETVDYFQAHFGSDPDEQENLKQLKQWLEHGARK